ncbi:MAG: hypothetical protein ACD_71C00246G0002 [uncultured bacterium (gcode 4)]|uniref:Uncharacterized protein n=1 Tax=uncultured bacterium (gcode 4) TaxID=1234023 RepID=K1ZI36_9BACT|nr:MAG: hypothetical protein ACD_71C00246G0002 [uncultured bacterium (gcode 4)]
MKLSSWKNSAFLSPRSLRRRSIKGGRSLPFLSGVRWSSFPSSNALEIGVLVSSIACAMTFLPCLFNTASTTSSGKRYVGMTISCGSILSITSESSFLFNVKLVSKKSCSIDSLIIFRTCGRERLIRSAKSPSVIVGRKNLMMCCFSSRVVQRSSTSSRSPSST